MLARRLPTAMAGALLLVALVFGVLADPGPAAAACDGFGPSVAAVRDTATVIVDGTVSWVKPSAGNVPTSWFDVTVERAIHGRPGPVVRIRGLNGSSCGGQPILMSPGQRVVLAIGAREFGRTMGAFYIYDDAGRIVDSTFGASGPYPGTKEALLRILAGSPDTSTAGTAVTSDRVAGDVPWLPILLAGIGGAIATGIRLGRRAPGPRRA